MIASRGANMLRTVSRNFSTSLKRQSGHDEGYPKPGSNLPFDITNRYKLTVYFMLFTGSAFGLPFYIWAKKPQ